MSHILNTIMCLYEYLKILATDYSDASQPILPAYDGTQGDLSLTLPPGAATKSVFTSKISF